MSGQVSCPDIILLNNPYAFKFGAFEEFSVRDSHTYRDGEIISRKTIEDGIDRGTAYRTHYIIYICRKQVSLRIVYKMKLFSKEYLSPILCAK